MKTKCPRCNCCKCHNYSIIQMDNIYTSFYPIYIFLKVLGNFSLSFDGSVANGRFRKKFSNVFFFCLMSFSLAFSIFINIRLQDVQRTSSLLLRHAWEISLILFLSAGALNHGYQAVTNTKIAEFLRLLNKFDVKVKSMLSLLHRLYARFPKNLYCRFLF